MDAIKTYNLSEKSPHPKFSNINMTIEKNCVYGLIELDDEVKHELLKTFLQPSDYYNGDIEVFGKQVTDDRDYLKRIGIVTDQLFFYEHLTVYENLKLHCEYSGFYDYKVIDDTLMLMNITEVKNELVKDISLKYKKKVAVARAILTSPELLILDDAIDGIDTESVKDIIDVLRALKTSRRTTILLASHNLSEVESIADKVGILSKGRLVKEMSIDHIRTANSGYYEIRTIDIKQAAVVLTKDLNLNSFKIIEPETIKIYDRTIHQNEILKALIAKDVSIDEFTLHSKTLEDYYLSIVGGV
ncbi:ABC transporter ATP-binding protein [Wukongibacter baidiensis]|uniref:ATP-binding cassette domain-containing protein n=1 Tax=Wukongibacter baidiensis TaxID=1723361 RepID=UPI003D7FBF7F